MNRAHQRLLGLAALSLAITLAAGRAPATPRGVEAERSLSVLVLLGEWFGDAYFPLAKEIEARGWTMKRIGVDVEYRGCYNKKRDVVLRSDILIPDLKDLSRFDVLIIPSGPQFRKFQENPAVLKFIRDAHDAGLLIASFCVGNFLVQAAGLVDGLAGQDSFPKEMTLARERVLIGPRGGGPPPGDGYESAPIKELCDAVAHELADKAVIEKVIRDNIGWALTKDRPLAESTMVHDESLFIFNPTSESTIGWSQLVKNFDFWMDPRFKATKCEIWDMRIGIARTGDVAWWSCMLNDLAEWDGKPTGWKDTRWTGVLEKRNGKWLIIQMHFSFAADKVAAQVKAKLEAEKADPKRK
jgi:hypothetical protein